jgi:hypothetical protein
MNSKIKTTLIIAAIVVMALPAMAQRKRVSPHETVSATVDGAKVSITYGRPYSKDPKSGEIRKIWGTLIPEGKVWRTGADEATLLVTDAPIQIGDVTVPAGTNSLYTYLGEGGAARLVINKQTGQWGTVYDEKKDLARVDLKKGSLDPQVDQFTITIDPVASGGAVLKLKWEKTEYSVALSVKK